MTILSHYTSRAGLEGIAQSKTLRATDFLQLNDTQEFFYAYEILQRAALEDVISKLPPGAIGSTFDLDAHIAQSSTAFRALFPPERGLMYVVSFAISATEDHQNRGLLTLWDRYTAFRGYCLQFAKEDIDRLLQLELDRGSYAAFSFERVIYGVDQSSRDYTTLVSQLSNSFLLQIARARPDLRLDPDFANMWPETVLQQRLMMFCGRHKDPCFEDEREMRILAFPADQATPRFLTGFARVKRRHLTPAGKSFIDIGEFWEPSLTPRRIIIGNRADADIESALSHYSFRPTVTHANLPIA